MNTKSEKFFGEIKNKYFSKQIGKEFFGEIRNKYFAKIVENFARSSLVKLRTNMLPKSYRPSAPGALVNCVWVPEKTSYNTNGISSWDMGGGS